MKNTLLIIFTFFAFNVFAQKSNPDTYKAMLGSQLKSDINIYYNPLMDNYDIHFVKLDIEVTDLSTAISGNVLIQAKASNLLDTLLFDFKYNMIVDSMFVNMQKITPVHNNNQIQYVFNPALEIDEDISAKIYYHGTPNPYDGGVTNDYNSNWQKNVTWTLSESFHAYEWWPCKQVLSDKIDSTYIFLTCDDDCMAGSNGLLTKVEPLPNNKKRFEWKTKYPMNYYLLSYAVAEYQDYSIYAYPDNSDPILIQNFIYNNASCLTYYKSGIDETASFIELFSEKFGLYPFANEKYGHCLTELGGGMEHQTMTTLGSFGYTLVAHELGHMWFGDYVTCASWQDIWINEGFASYTEYVALENLQSLDNAKAWMKTAQNYALEEPNRSVYIPFTEAFNEGRIFNYRLSYKKGAVILHILRHEINNDELFFTGLQNYLSEYGDSVATGDDFKNSMEEYTGMDFEAFFDQWYYGIGSPRFEIGYNQNNDTLKMTVTQSGSSSKTPLFQLFVDYKIYYNGGDTIIRKYQGNNIETFKIPFSKVVSNVVVDPDNWILKRTGTLTSLDLPENSKSLLSFSPNPVKETMNINFNSQFSHSVNQVQILDINGRIIASYKSNYDSYPIDVSFLSPGMYFIKGLSSNKAYTYKFVKQ